MSTTPSTPVWLLTALAAVVTGLSGCATPTLPLPPPSALMASAPDVNGLVTVTGEVNPDAYVYCLNLDQDRGVFDRADMDGRFSLQIAANIGEYLSIHQQSGTDQGPPFEIRVPAP